MLLFDESKRFYKGNLHTHTTNSDGRKDPADVIELYQTAGYDFLAITDHWKMTVEKPTFYKNMLLLPGIELDYSWIGQVIHIVGIGMRPELLERAERRHTARRGAHDIRQCGGRVILAHPAWSLNTVETIATLAPDLTATEIYNSVSAAPWNGDRADSAQVLDVAATHGIVLNTVASDDSHFYTGEQATSYIMLQADELSQEAILVSLDRGAFYATRGPRVHQVEVTDTQIRVTCDPVSMVLFHSDLVWSRNRCVSGDGLTEAVYDIRRDALERFVRVILIDKDGRRAWVNPIDLSRV